MDHHLTRMLQDATLAYVFGYLHVSKERKPLTAEDTTDFKDFDWSAAFGTKSTQDRYTTFLGAFDLASERFVKKP